MKHLARLLHLWTGLIFGTILVILGLSGSALSWIHELDSMLNPGLLHVAPPAGMREGDRLPFDPFKVLTVSDKLATTPGYGRPSMLELPERAGDVFVAWYRPTSGADEAPWKQAVTRQVMLDPATLQVLGERGWGEAGLSRPLIMPTLFHAHRYLLAGELGKVVVAVAGVSLAIAMLTGLVLWWPRMSRSAIWHALTVRHGGSWIRFNFQLHRAGGFFAAPVLLVTAVSGVYFNMPQWVKPVIDVVAPMSPAKKVANNSQPGAVGISVADAVLSAQARFPEGRVSRVSFPASDKVPFEIRVRQPGELRMGPGATRISVDSGDGRVLKVIDPQSARSGDKLVSWLFPLHTGEAFGVAGRIIISFVGLLPLAFFVTGLLIWIKIRKKKLI
jgi:uncharacterized iron-regulated membrane protein